MANQRQHAGIFPTRCRINLRRPYFPSHFICSCISLLRCPAPIAAVHLHHPEPPRSAGKPSFPRARTFADLDRLSYYLRYYKYSTTEPSFLVDKACTPTDKPPLLLSLFVRPRYLPPDPPPAPCLLIKPPHLHLASPKTIQPICRRRPISPFPSVLRTRLSRNPVILYTAPPPLPSTTSK